MRDLEMSESDAKNKYAETKTKLLETEDVVIGLRASIKQLEMQLGESQEVIMLKGGFALSFLLEKSISCSLQSFFWLVKWVHVIKITNEG